MKIILFVFCLFFALIKKYTEVGKKVLEKLNTFLNSCKKVYNQLNQNFYMNLHIIVDKITPSTAPWNDIPPCQILKISNKLLI